MAQNVRKALAYSYAEKYLTLAVGFGATMVLARLLTPAEFGVFSIGALVAGIAQSLRSFGPGSYLIQKKAVSEQAVRATFAVNLAIGGLLALTLAVLSEPLARFYEEPGVRAVMLVLAVNFVLQPFGSVIHSLLTREMRFAPLLWVGGLRAVVNAAVAIGLAWQGMGYMSIAFAAVAATFTSMVMLNLFRPAGLPWLPGLRGIREVLSFGGKVGSAAILRELGRAAPALAIGKALGFGAAGQFGRAESLLTVFNKGVMSAAYPVYLTRAARERRSQDGDPRQMYLTGVAYATGLAWPFFALTGVLAEPLVFLLFGNQWGPAIPVLQLLCAAQALSFLVPFSEQTFVAAGRPGHQLRVHAVVQPAKIIAVAGLAFVGLAYVALGILAVNLLYVAVTYRLLAGTVGVQLRDYVPVAVKSAGLGLLAALGASLGLYALGQGQSYGLAVLVGGTASVTAAVAGAILMRHPLARELEALWQLGCGALLGKPQPRN